MVACVGDPEIPPECEAAEAAYNDLVRRNDELVEQINDAGGLLSAPDDLTAAYEANQEEMDRVGERIEDVCPNQ
jgi:hypothetical protein